MECDVKFNGPVVTSRDTLETQATTCQAHCMQCRHMVQLGMGTQLLGNNREPCTHSAENMSCLSRQASAGATS